MDACDLGITSCRINNKTVCVCLYVFIMICENNVYTAYICTDTYIQTRNIKFFACAICKYVNKYINKWQINVNINENDDYCIILRSSNISLETYGKIINYISSIFKNIGSKSSCSLINFVSYLWNNLKCSVQCSTFSVI